MNLQPKNLQEKQKILLSKIYLPNDLPKIKRRRTSRTYEQFQNIFGVYGYLFDKNIEV